SASDPPESLRDLLRTRVDRLSGGQFQLLTVWACLGGEANVVVLDEPSNNLYPAAVDALADLLHATRGDRGVLVVTHDERFLSRVSANVLEVGR
ncbi:MAG: AAA family ATPase, partial [Thermoanaerobaculia bacterium]|nr:AAA family ATPase [Thermoanaerobaculia bacterium]